MTFSKYDFQRGVVLLVDGHGFWVRFECEGSPDEEALIPIYHVRDKDRPLCVPGAYIELVTAHYGSPGGRVETRVDIRFIDMGTWTQEELDEARQRAKELAVILGIEQ